VGGRYGYVAAGWRFGNLLPMLMMMRSENELFGNKTGSFNGVGASLRYDVAPNVALKAQVDRHRADDSGAFALPRTGDTSKVNIYTVGLDFVF
jgi:hypothetical protein